MSNSKIALIPKIKVVIRERAAASPSSVDPKHFDIRELIKMCQMNHVIVRGNKENICKTLSKRLYGTTYRNNDADAVIYRTFSRWILYKLGACHLKPHCNNDCDFYSSANIDNVPECYLFFTGNTSEQVFGYDIRSLVCYRDTGSSQFRNPYTDQPFTSDDLQRLERKELWLQRLGYEIQYPQPRTQDTKWTDRRIQQYAVNVFSAISEHQYVDHEWFTNLPFTSLKCLYHELYEIWNYRLPMQSSHKAYITAEPVFSNWNNVQKYQPSMANKLRVELLKNIEKLVTEGRTEDHRKNGCYIAMLGLVLVSEDAATSHPYMYQAAYYDEDE